jgi:extracellular elastinolytic metalloproteinase
MVLLMRKQILRSAPVALLFLAGCVSEPTDLAAPQKVMADGTKIFRSDIGRLTSPSIEAPAVVAMDFLVHNRRIEDTGNVSVASHSSDNITHVKVTQTIDGLRVHGAYAKVAVADTGEILQVIERLAATNVEMEPAVIGERDAVSIALLHLGFRESPGEAKTDGNFTYFTPTRELYRAPSVERVAFIGEDGAPYAGFLVETWSGHDNQLDYTLIDGDGKIVSVEHRTNNDSYKIFPIHPSKSSQTVVDGPGAGNAQSPWGWLSGAQTTFQIAGNNVTAYLDTDANGLPDSGGIAITDGNFLATADLTQPPSATTNKAVAVQNLFYLNNVAHDVLNSHGFTEATGNFQQRNLFVRGENDAVNAEAQDGGGTNNANFATPPDGSAPRMQMYLYSGATPEGVTTVNGVDYVMFGSEFGPAFTAAGVTGPLVVYNDNAGVTSDACQAAPTGSLTGMVAIVDRGNCIFPVKVLNAQNAGAIGVVIVNNVAGNAFKPTGTDPGITIPSGMVTQANGATLKNLAGSSANLGQNPAPNIMIDSDIDADVVFHEYGHGLTWRMVGGMNGPLGVAVGEGASDVFSFLMTGDDIMGEYSSSWATGIRRYRYNNYPLTYSAFAAIEEHNDGEIYAAAMWRVYQSYLAAGYPPSQMLRDFVHGLDFTPSTPAFEDMRDGMLQATAGTRRACLIWRGFAASGIGVDAVGRDNNNGTVSVVESFDIPSSCL